MGTTKPIVVLLFIIALTFTVTATTALPEGGTGYDDAVELDIGQEYNREEIVGEKEEFFYIDGIKPGQMVKFEGYFTPLEHDHCSLRLKMHNEDRRELGFEIMDQSFTKVWLPNSDQDSYTYYITIYNRYCSVEMENLEITLEDKFDAGSDTDAGDNPDEALEIEEGSYTGWLSGDSGTDEVDMYSIQVEEGEELSTELIPDSDAGYHIRYYNEDRSQVASTSSDNPGAITRLSYRSDRDQEMYIEIEEHHYNELAEYEFEVTRETPEAAELTVETLNTEGNVILLSEELDNGFKELELDHRDADTWSTTVEVVPGGEYMLEFESVTGFESPELSEMERYVNLGPGESKTIQGTYVQTGEEVEEEVEDEIETVTEEEGLLEMVANILGIENPLLLILVPAAILFVIIVVIILIIGLFIKMMTSKNKED